MIILDWSIAIYFAIPAGVVGLIAGVYYARDILSRSNKNNR